MIRPLEVAVDLRAEKPAGHGVRGVTLDADGPTAAIDGDERGAGVRAVVWAGSTDYCSGYFGCIRHNSAALRAKTEGIRLFPLDMVTRPDILHSASVRRAR